MAGLPAFSLLISCVAAYSPSISNVVDDFHSFLLGLYATVNGAHRLSSFITHSMVFPLIFLSFAPRPRTVCEFVRVRLISFSVITLALCIPFSRPPLVYRYCIPVLCIIVSPTPTHIHRPPSPNHCFPLDALSLLRFL